MSDEVQDLNRRAREGESCFAARDAVSVWTASFPLHGLVTNRCSCPQGKDARFPVPQSLKKYGKQIHLSIRFEHLQERLFLHRGEF